jgi:hypothetical protein
VLKLAERQRIEAEQRAAREKQEAEARAEREKAAAVEAERLKARQAEEKRLAEEKRKPKSSARAADVKQRKQRRHQILLKAESQKSLHAKAVGYWLNGKSETRNQLLR